MVDDKAFARVPERPSHRFDAVVRRTDLEERLAAIDWASVEAGLDQVGAVPTGGLLTSEECAALVALYAEDAAFRSTVSMQRHGYGRGEYKYFAYPLPAPISSLRHLLYQHLVPLANRWNEAMGVEVRYPADHAHFIERCHRAGQCRPTPLLLRYGSGDYNCLHQDLYGEHVFPLQLAVLLSRPGQDFAGGEFVITEQRPRQQSRVEVVSLAQGEGVIFAVHQRPLRGARGVGKVNIRHGVSRIRSGQRHTLGVILHDAA